MRLTKIQSSSGQSIFDAGNNLIGNLFAGSIKEFEVCRITAFQQSLDIQDPIRIMIGQILKYPYVRHLMIPVASKQITVTGHTAQAPEILVFVITPVTPARHLESEKIIPLFQIRGHIKLSLGLGILRIAYEVPVDPQMDIRSDRSEMSDHLFAVPTVRDRNDPAIASHMIILDRNLRRIILKMPPPGKTNVHILRITIAVQFPYSGNRHRFPRRIIITNLVKIHRALVQVSHPIEFPRSIQA